MWAWLPDTKSGTRSGCPRPPSNLALNTLHISHLARNTSSVNKVSRLFSSISVQIRYLSRIQTDIPSPLISGLQDLKEEKHKPRINITNLIITDPWVYRQILVLMRMGAVLLSSVFSGMDLPLSVPPSLVWLGMPKYPAQLLHRVVNRQIINKTDSRKKKTLDQRSWTQMCKLFWSAPVTIRKINAMECC